MRKLLTLLVAAAVLMISVVPALAQDENLLDRAQRATQLDTLLAAIDAAGLSDTLANEGPFTVFAPTNGAFEELLTALDVTPTQILFNTDLLTDVLLKHVVAGEVRAADILAQIEENGVAELETLGGETLTAALLDGAVYLEGGSASVVITDLSASNGLVHIIDGVLAPNNATLGVPDFGTVVDVLASNPEYSTLVAAIETAGLTDTLAGEGPFTVFAPTNDTFEGLLEEFSITQELLLSDPELLSDILTYHVLPIEADAATVLSLDLPGTARTVNGAFLNLDVVDGGVFVGGEATVLTADVYASNGVIHTIDHVMHLRSTDEALMAISEANTIGAIAADAGTFTTLLAAAEAAGLTETLTSEGTLTVFAPTDEAFAAALEELGLTAEELLEDTDTLTAILTYHVVGFTATSGDLAELGLPRAVRTVNGGFLNLSVDADGNVMVNDATVTAADLVATNGVIHVIDSVLLP